MIWQRYEEVLGDWCEASSVRRPIAPEQCEQTCHMYYLLMSSLETRTAFIEYLAENDNKAVLHYLPLHRSDYAQRLASKFDLKGACHPARRPYGSERSKEQNAEYPVTKNVSDRLVRLPFSRSMRKNGE